MIRALALAFAAALAGSAAAAPLEVETAEVPHGARLLLAPREGRRATLVVQFARGSVDDDNHAGVTRVAQHVLLAANARLDWQSFMTALYAGGGSLSLQTDLRSCAFVLEADRREFDVLAPTLLGALLGARVDRARFPVAIERALHDAREPGHGTGLLESVAQIASSDSRYYNEPYGDPDEIELVEPNAVEELIRGALAPANATIVAAGSFDRQRLVSVARRHAGGHRVALSPPPFNLPVRSSGRTAREAHILAWPMDIQWPRDAAIARVLAAVTERVLWHRFREGGVAYSFEVAAARTPGVDLFVVALPVRSGVTGVVADALAAAIEDVRRGNFDDALFERARAIALGELAWEDERPEALAAALAAGGAPWHGRALDEALRALDRRTLLERSAALLAPDRAIALHFGPTVERRRP